MDIRIKQELPAFNKDHTFNLFLDIENFGNLLNSDWGRVEVTEYEYERDVVSAKIVDGQYEYFDLNSNRSIQNLRVRQQSVWQIQFGLKYEF
jgi:hypothetical protein